ncbi:MAG: DUF4136 domain-containing protein [Silvibacterium sp.]|nr:DUF4136 domain-containing protein [Silvibacterium sp.]
MKTFSHLTLCAALILGSAAVVSASNVRTDYDHTVNFAQYHTYSWGQVKTTDPFYVKRIKDAVNQQLQAKGWQPVATGGSVTIFCVDNLHNQKETQTMYDGFGGGWGGGWGWGAWGWGAPGGFGETTTTTTTQQVSHLVVDLFDSATKSLLWRGITDQDLSSNSDKNTKNLDNDIKRMFKDFPPKGGR